MKTPDRLAQAFPTDDPVLLAAAPMRLAAPAARPGWASGLGWGVGPEAVVAMEGARLLRAGFMWALATLFRPPPHPVRIEVGPGLVLVANYRPGLHAFFVQGADGRWRLSPVVGRGTPDGVLVADLPALARDYGRPLPPGVLAMAAPRPAGVPARLQTTGAGIAKAMADSNDPCGNQPGQRHHMIPAVLMRNHQRFLTLIGFTLDQGANMIKLPSDAAQKSGMAQLCQQDRPIHNGRTANHYHDAVSSQLNAIEGEMNAGDITARQAAAKVDRLMSLLRQELQSGRYANVNDPALARVIESWRI